MGLSVVRGALLGARAALLAGNARVPFLHRQDSTLTRSHMAIFLVAD
jgi:hypothetical protein